MTSTTPRNHDDQTQPANWQPGIVRSLIDQVSPGTYLELYGRDEIPNSQWTVYGNQVERRSF